MFRAAILAAGEGSRLAASGIATPKALVPVHGEPMIVRLARQLRDVGGAPLHALVHPRARAAADGLRSAGLDVRCRFATTPASFLSLCELLPALRDEPFLLSLVDSVCETAELAAFAARARDSDADAWLGVTSFVHDDAPLRVQLDHAETVAAIGGAAAAASPFVTGGVYWFGAGLAGRAERARARGITRLREFLSSLVEEGLVMRAHAFSRIVDVDTIDDLRLLARAAEIR